MACTNIMWLFRCHLHTAFKLQMILMSYFWNCWPRLFLLLSYYCYSFRKQIHNLSLCISVSFCCLSSAAFESFGPFLPRFTKESQGIVSWSNFLENRRKNTPCTSESPCCMLALAKVQTGNSFTVSAHMELLVSNGLPSLVLTTIRPLIPPNKEEKLN